MGVGVAVERRRGVAPKSVTNRRRGRSRRLRGEGKTSPGHGGETPWGRGRRSRAAIASPQERGRGSEVREESLKGRKLRRVSAGSCGDNPGCRERTRRGRKASKHPKSVERAAPKRRVQGEQEAAHRRGKRTYSHEGRGASVSKAREFLETRDNKAMRVASREIEGEVQGSRLASRGGGDLCEGKTLKRRSPGTVAV